MRYRPHAHAQFWINYEDLLKRLFCEESMNNFKRYIDSNFVSEFIDQDIAVNEGPHVCKEDCGTKEHMSKEEIDEAIKYLTYGDHHYSAFASRVALGSQLFQNHKHTKTCEKKGECQCRFNFPRVCKHLN